MEQFSLEFIINLCINIVLIIFVLYLIVNMHILKKRLRKFLPKNKNFNIQEMLISYNSNVIEVLEKESQVNHQIDKINNNIKNSVDELNKKIELTNKNLSFATQKIGFLRYNPFDEVGGDFSYVIAFLDENNNGILINSIYSRENCYSYAKEITKGLCLKYKLSNEEETTLKMAIEKH